MADTYAAWDITNPESGDDFEQEADISCGGGVDQTHGTGFNVQLIQNHVVKQSDSGTANELEGQLEDWTATLDNPSGGWDSGAATVKLIYNLSGVTLDDTVNININEVI